MVMKLMSIRRSGICSACDVTLPESTRAWWDNIERHLTCTTCRPANTASAVRIPEPAVAHGSVTSASNALPPPSPIDHGIGGSSARKEYERRSARHNKRIEEKWGTGRVGKVAKFFAPEPQSIAAWAKGADGEGKIAKRLDRDLGSIATMLHDRKVPNTRGNIDHLVVAPTGIWIIDAKNYSGKVECRDVGNWRSDEQRLYVGGRNQTTLVRSMEWQADAVQASIDAIGLGAVPMHRYVCFTDAEWGFFAKPFRIGGVWVGWPKALVESVQGPAILDDGLVTTLAHQLSAWFPASR